MREGNISRTSVELVKIKLKKGTRKMRSDIHTLVLISELTESREGSEEEEEEETDTDDEVWKISQEEFHGSSPEL